MPFAVVLLITANPSPAFAQTQAERCLAMRLALVGSSLSNSLACQAWSVATRIDPSAPCLVHGEEHLAQQLRAAGSATEQQIAELVEKARDATALLVDSQVQASRLAQYESTLWDTEVIADLERGYQTGMSWPDESCRAKGYCPGLMIFDCRSTQHADGSIDTTCDTLPESSSQISGAPVVTTENVSLPTGEILSRGSSGAPYEVVITLSDDRSAFKGVGYGGSWPLFLRGHRIG